MLMLGSMYMYVASQQCLGSHISGRVHPTHLLGASPPCPTFLSQTFLSLTFPTFSCSAHSLCTGKWPPGPARRSGQWCQLLCCGPHQNPGYKSIFGIFFVSGGKHFCYFCGNQIVYISPEPKGSDYVIWRHVIIQWGSNHVYKYLGQYLGLGQLSHATHITTCLLETCTSC